jgi:hypothetical protein
MPVKVRGSGSKVLLLCAPQTHVPFFCSYRFQTSPLTTIVSGPIDFPEGGAVQVSKIKTLIWWWFHLGNGEAQFISQPMIISFWFIIHIQIMYMPYISEPEIVSILNLEMVHILYTWYKSLYYNLIGHRYQP